MHDIYDQRESIGGSIQQARSGGSPSALEKAQRAVGIGARISPTDAILQTLDEAIKRVYAVTEELDNKLQPLNGERPTPESPIETRAVPGYDYASTLMTSLEDRARQVKNIADRLGGICARTEL